MEGTGFMPVKRMLSFGWVRWLAVIVYAYIVFRLCLMPSSQLPKSNFLDKIFFDKWVHIMMYFGMWSLLVWTFKGPGKLTFQRNRIFISSLVICLLMGACIELLQAQIGRSVDWTDELANLAGILLAWLFWRKFEHRWGIYSW